MSLDTDYEWIKSFTISQILSIIDWDYDGDIERYVDEKWLDKQIATTLRSVKVMMLPKLKKHKELKRLFDDPKQLVFEIKKDFRQMYESTKKWRAEQGMKGHHTRTPSKKFCPVKVDFRKML